MHYLILHSKMHILNLTSVVHNGIMQIFLKATVRNFIRHHITRFPPTNLYWKRGIKNKRIRIICELYHFPHEVFRIWNSKEKSKDVTFHLILNMRRKSTFHNFILKQNIIIKLKICVSLFLKSFIYLLFYWTQSLNVFLFKSEKVWKYKFKIEFLNFHIACR